MRQMLTRTSILLLSAIAIFLLALQPALAQQKASWGEEVLPGEEKHWYARSINKSYRDASKAKDDIAQLKELGIKNAQTRMRPWYYDDKTARDSELVIGPFATKEEAEDVMIFIYRKTKELYQASYMPWSLGTGTKSEVYLVSVSEYASMDAADNDVKKLIDMGFFPERAGTYSDNTTFYWRTVASGYKLKSNAEKVAKRLQANGFKNAAVLTINWDIIDKLEDRRVAYQAKAAETAQRSRKGDGAYGLDYQQQQWESCVRSNSGYTGGNYNTGKADWKCGTSPLSK